MFEIVEKYVSTPSEKSGYKLCQTNIYVEELYYEVVDYDKEVLLTFCEFCKPKFIKKINEI